MRHRARARRPLLWLAWTALAAGLSGLLWLSEGSGVQGALLSGWALLLCCLALAGYNLRKRLSFLPVGPSAAWLRLHLGVGWLSVLLFLLHAGAPERGPLEALLWALYLLVAGTGVAGIYLSRVVPRRLASTGEELIYERLPALRSELRRRVQEAVLEATSSEALLGLYATRLHGFLSARRDSLAHLRRVPGEAEELLAALDSSARRARESEQPHFATVQACVRRKAIVDDHEVHQGLLKVWLLVHVPATCALLALAALHALLAHAYGALA